MRLFFLKTIEFLEQALGFFLVIPELGFAGERFYFAKTSGLSREVKDTPVFCRIFPTMR
jgi:hypothetical protein